LAGANLLLRFLASVLRLSLEVQKNSLVDGRRLVLSHDLNLGLLVSLVELTVFANEVVVAPSRCTAESGVDDQQGGAVCGVASFVGIDLLGQVPRPAPFRLVLLVFCRWAEPRFVELILR
jgi:hypothetical protein